MLHQNNIIMIRQIYLNDKPLNLFTDKEGAYFEALIHELLQNNDEVKEMFNESYNLLCIGSTGNLEVFVWGDEDSKTFELKEINIL